MISLIAFALTLNPATATAQTLRGTCLFTTPYPNPRPLGEAVAYTLDDEHTKQELRREGSSTYFAIRQSYDEEGKPSRYFFTIRVEDPSRDLIASATRPAGPAWEDQLQFNPPFSLPLVICNPAKSVP